MKTALIPKILIVEDNAIYRKLLGTMIERITGVAPHTAANGEEALSLCRQTQFDLLFMDNHMPVLGGILATRKIRESIPALQQPVIIAVTGSSDQRDCKAFSEAGINGMLNKPFGLADLEACIESALAGAALPV